jgi:hypothetical protein
VHVPVHSIESHGAGLGVEVRGGDAGVGDEVAKRTTLTGDTKLVGFSVARDVEWMNLT